MKSSSILMYWQNIVRSSQHGNAIKKAKMTFSLPSTTAKFLNPIASNRFLIVSDNSGIWEKIKQAVSVEAIK